MQIKRNLLFRGSGILRKNSSCNSRSKIFFVSEVLKGADSTYIDTFAPTWVLKVGCTKFYNF